MGMVQLMGALHGVIVEEENTAEIYLTYCRTLIIYYQVKNLYRKHYVFALSLTSPWKRTLTEPGPGPRFRGASGAQGKKDDGRCVVQFRGGKRASLNFFFGGRLALS